MISTIYVSLDRVVIFLAMMVYFSFGIPIEEEKLIRIFGQDYVEYRKRVPALFPIGYGPQQQKVKKQE